MTVLNACQLASKEMGLTAPTAIYASTGKYEIELSSIANESAYYIAKEHDWQLFTTLQTETGDDSTTAFDLPSDYDRMTYGVDIFKTTGNMPMEHVTDLNTWRYRRLQGLSAPFGEWIIIGGQVNIYAAMSSSETATYYYQSNKICADSGDTAQASFTADTDYFRLSERLLKLCIKWKWREMKKLDSADEQMEFEIALAQEITRDKGATTLHTDELRPPSHVKWAWPGTLGA